MSDSPFTNVRFNPPQTTPIEIGGVTYHAAPVKRASVMLAALTGEVDQQVTALFRWLMRSLNKDHFTHEEAQESCQACHLNARLSDDDDPIEVEDVLTSANELYGKAANLPTGSPTAS